MSTGVDVYSTTPASNGTIGGTGYFPEGQAPSTVNDAARQVMADIAAWYGGAKAPEYLTGTAGTNTVTATGPASLAAYATGQRFILVPANKNTGATTVNITPSGGAALGAKNLFASNVACVGGELITSAPVVIVYDGTQFQIVGRARQPTRQVLTSGTGATYTTPTMASRIVVRMVGGGGGGAAVNTNNGANGTNTTFSTFTASAGAGGVTAGGNGGAGGAAAGGTINIPGGAGQGGGANATATTFLSGGQGGSSVFGGGGGGGNGNNGGSVGATNSGGGGGGAGGIGGGNSGGGGGSGGYVEAVISAPSSTYTYTVGAGGNGGAAGAIAGSNGAAGIIIVDEWYD